MIRLRLGADALARVRFGISPLAETVRSVRVLDDPSGRPLHLRWAATARRATARLDLSVVLALQPTHAYSPDFLQPPPVSPLADLGEELDRMLATPPEQVRAEILRAYSGGPLPRSLERLVEDPERGLADLAELLRAYWRAALEPHWPRIRALQEGDVLYRARQIADGGAERLFADLDPSVRWRAAELIVDKRAEGLLEVDDRGLLLMPSVFVWPAVVAVMDPAWQPTLVYPARGVALLWEPAAARAPEALAALLGRRRADILLALDQPRSTAELARRLAVPDSSVSQHLTVMRAAGLVTRHRVGRVVLYMRSAAGYAVAGDAG